MKKIFVFLPDGVGLRNFAFTSFKEKGEKLGYEIIYWNNTSFPLNSEFGFNEVKIENTKLHKLTNLYKRAKIRIELDLFAKKYNDKTFLTYKFSQSYRGIKNSIKSWYVNFLVLVLRSNKGLKYIQNKIEKKERLTVSYQNAKKQLIDHSPEIIFCTNQRSSEAIAPVLAAKDLDIKTATFIFSWDNLPKATKIIDTDYYFVWSDYMKNELMEYYPEIDSNSIIVCGTPQFESHFNESLLMTREEFCKRYKLDVEKKYICFSGDDVTTSPFDEYYLNDLAEQVNELNNSGENLGVIFRKCPVDYSGRYDFVLNKFPEIIKAIDPDWKRTGSVWNTIMPTKNDMSLLVNTIKHSEFVVNIGSSMVFDYVCFDKPCMYINYEQPFLSAKDKSIKEIYNYIHFRSMPNKDAVIWIQSKNDFKTKIMQTLKGEISNVEGAKKWFEIINKAQPENASNEIWKGIQKITA